MTGKIQKLNEIKQRGGWVEVGSEITRFVIRKSPKVIRYPARYGIKQGIPFYVYENINKFKQSETSGDPIWDYDWDLLIILDCCRHEWLNKVAKEYSWIQSVKSKRSVGSNSATWVSNTFDEVNPSLLSNVQYITGCHYSDMAPVDSLGEYINISNRDDQFSLSSCTRSDK